MGLGLKGLGFKVYGMECGMERNPALVVQHLEVGKGMEQNMETT